MESVERGVLRYGAILALIFLIACAVYLIVVHQFGIETEVIRDRYWKNVEPLFNGEVPIMEYPPLALVFMAIPRFFGTTPWAYNTAYVAEVLIFMVVGLYLVAKLAERFGYGRKRAMLIYAILMLLMLEFVVDRYDIFPAIITLASFYLFTGKRYGWAFMLLAVGTLTKLYPAMLFPLYFLYLVYNVQWKDALKGTLAFIGTGAAVIAAVWLIEPEMILNFIGYHEDRPLQLESVASSVLYLISMTGLFDVEIQPFAENPFGSDNLVGTVPDAVAGVLMPIMILSILAVFAAYAWRRRSTDDVRMRVLGLAILAAVMLFMVVNKVFSSQYLIWAIPPMVFLFMVCGNERFKRRLLASGILVLALTQLNFAYNAGYCAGDIGDLGMLIILVRNIVAVYLTAIVIREMIRTEDGDDAPSPMAAERRSIGAREIISRYR